jgi:hypothetical protein
MAMRAVPMTRDSTNAYLVEHHRHHGRVSGYRFAVGAEVGGRLVGVAVIGRPRARMIDQYRVAEVNRVCTDGTRNACSFLYGISSRVCRDLGFDRVFTCILETESGASLKAAGWVYEYTTAGGAWDRPSRHRGKVAPEGRKQVWAPAWCAVVREPKQEVA